MKKEWQGEKSILKNLNGIKTSQITFNTHPSLWASIKKLNSN